MGFCHVLSIQKWGENNLTKSDKEKKAILVVSFGTSYNHTRESTIGAIEKRIAESYKDYEVRRAFTSQVIINVLHKRDGIEVDNVTQAMSRLVSDGFSTVICQPTHVMNGIEYHDMVEAVNNFKDKINFIEYGAPLLSSVDDYQSIVNIVNNEVCKSITSINGNDALVLMGHGTNHFANSTYSALDYKFKDNGNKNIFIGTVESYPDLGTVIKKVKELGAKKVYLTPLMIVAGDHACNDMASDEDSSWKTKFNNEGFEVETIIKGLGEYRGIQNMFVEHVGEAISRRIVSEAKNM